MPNCGAVAPEPTVPKGLMSAGRERISALRNMKLLKNGEALSGIKVSGSSEMSPA
jgi:hypothetical protein